MYLYRVVVKPMTLGPRPLMLNKKHISTLFFSFCVY